MPMKGKKRLTVLLFTAGLFFLAGFHDLMHNHEADLCLHPDCPVFILINTVQALPGASPVLLFLLFIVFYRNLPQNESIKPKFFPFSRETRAPPFLY
ncbi:MAG: hypothetical protein QG657_1355 [Acidobacteriota bacterium]|nr:hypothetical protein [Acidobacteriota bacterium]